MLKDEISGYNTPSLKQCVHSYATVYLYLTTYKDAGILSTEMQYYCNLLLCVLHSSNQCNHEFCQHFVASRDLGILNFQVNTKL